MASSSHKAFSGIRLAGKPSRPAPPAGPESFPTSASERNVAHVNNLRGNRTAEPTARWSFEPTNILHVFRAPFLLHAPATPKPFMAAPSKF